MAQNLPISQKRVQARQRTLVLAGLAVVGFVGVSAVLGGLIWQSQNVASTVPISADADLAINCKDGVYQPFTKALDPKKSLRWNFNGTKENPFRIADGTAEFVSRASEANKDNISTSIFSFQPKVRGDFVVQAGIKNFEQVNFDPGAKGFLDFNMDVAGQRYYFRVLREGDKYRVNIRSGATGETTLGTTLLSTGHNFVMRAVRLNDQLVFAVRSRDPADSSFKVLTKIPFAEKGPVSNIHMNNYLDVSVGAKTGRQQVNVENFSVMCSSDLKSVDWIEDESLLIETE